MMMLIREIFQSRTIIDGCTQQSVTRKTWCSWKKFWERLRVFYILSFVCISLLHKTKIIHQIQKLHSRRLNLHRQCMKLHHSLNFAFASEKNTMPRKNFHDQPCPWVLCAFGNILPIYEVFNTCVLYINIDFNWFKKKSHKKYKNDVFTSKALYQKRKQS